MTRKQALLRAANILSDSGENKETVALLKEIYEELPLTHWTDKSIKDTVRQFIEDNGRVPTATDFKRNGMPPHTVIKQKYNITLGEWLDKNFPRSKDTYNELKKKYTQQFTVDYCRIKPSSQDNFNKRRSENSRSWQTVAKYNGVKTWRDLIKVLELPDYSYYSRTAAHKTLRVKVITDYDFADPNS